MAACPRWPRGRTANRDLIYIGVSGDGDTASIGLGQFAHGARRNLNMTYIVENNGCYGSTKGLDSATMDTGTVNKKGDQNLYPHGCGAPGHRGGGYLCGP